MTKVYVVTTGDYSDYGIEAICSTRELADKLAKMIDDMDSPTRVKEFQLDPEKEILNRGYGYWDVHMRRDGKVIHAFVSREKPDKWDPEFAEVYTSDEGSIRCKMDARDCDHAVKIANERRTAILAAHQWPDDPPTEE